jgi:hypothetical protein
MIFLNSEEIKSFTNFSTLGVFLTMILDTKDMLLITIAIQITLVLVPKIKELGHHLVREGFIQTLTSLNSENSLDKMNIYSIKTKRQSTLEEVMNLNSPHPGDKKKAGKDKEADEFFKQLQNYHENPTALLEMLKQMKSEQMGIGSKEEFIEEKNHDDYDEDEAAEMEEILERERLGMDEMEYVEFKQFEKLAKAQKEKMAANQKPPGPKLDAGSSGNPQKLDFANEGDLKMTKIGDSGLLINEEDIFSHSKERTKDLFLQKAQSNHEKGKLLRRHTGNSGCDSPLVLAKTYGSNRIVLTDEPVVYTIQQARSDLSKLLQKVLLVVDDYSSKNSEQIKTLLNVYQLFNSNQDSCIEMMSRFYENYDRVTLYESNNTNIFSKFNEYLLESKQKTPYLKLNNFYTHFFKNGQQNFKKFVEN